MAPFLQNCPRYYFSAAVKTMIFNQHMSGLPFCGGNPRRKHFPDGPHWSISVTRLWISGCPQDQVIILKFAQVLPLSLLLANLSFPQVWQPCHWVCSISSLMCTLCLSFWKYHFIISFETKLCKADSGRTQWRSRNSLRCWILNPKQASRQSAIRDLSLAA